MALSKGRREQLEQAKQNAKEKAKQKQNKALIQQYNATHKNAPKQKISAKGGGSTGSRNTRQSTGTTRNTASKTRMNGSLGNSFGGSKTGLPTWTCKEEQQWLNIMAGQARSCALT